MDSVGPKFLRTAATTLTKLLLGMGLCEATEDRSCALAERICRESRRVASRDENDLEDWVGLDIVDLEEA